MHQAILNLLSRPLFSLLYKKRGSSVECDAANNLSEAELNKEYRIKNVVSEDTQTLNFLFTLGCFKGQAVTVISVLSETYVITIKDARYSIDSDLAKAVILV